MKIIDQHPEFFFFVYLPFWIIVSIAYVLRAPQLVSGFTLQWLFVPLFLIALAHPNTKLHIPLSSAKRPPWRYFFECALFQIALITTMMSNTAFFTQNPQHVYHTFIHDYAIGPMSFFSLIAGALAVVYAKGARPQISSLLKPWFNNTHIDRVGIMTDAYMRSSTFISLGMIVVTMMFCAMTLINTHYGLHFRTGFNVPTVILMTVLILTAHDKRFGQALRPLLNHLPHVITVLLVTCLSIIAIYIIYTLGVAIEPKGSLHPEFFTHWDHQQYTVIMVFFFMLTWLAPYPGLMVHLGQGYQIRTMLVTSMIIPLAWALWVTWAPPGELFYKALPWAAIIASIYLLCLFVHNQRITYLTRAILPVREKIKQRSSYAYVKGLLNFSLTVMSAYFLTGVYLVGYAIFIMMMPVAILMAMGIRSLYVSD